MKKYTHNVETHNTRAAEIVVPYLMELFSPKSAIDVGCGLGTWLQVFKEHGCSILGADWPEIDRTLLLLADDEFVPVDLEKGLQINQRYDIAICLEVAEHLSSNSSNQFVSDLTSLSDLILFSAAIPNQGGDNHVNEQYADYWQEKFEAHGYFFYDIFREKYWNNSDIEWWYRQNMFLVSKSDLKFPKSRKINTYIHPGLFNKKLDEINSYYTGEHSITTGIKFLLKTVLFKFRKHN